MMRLTILLLTSLSLCAASLPATALTPGDEQAAKYLRQRAIQRMDEIRDGISEAKGLREPERTQRLDALMDEVIAPLIYSPESLASLYGDHWAEVESLGMETDALTAATTLLRDNYLFILERSLKKKIKVQRVVVRGQNAEVKLRVFARKTLPMDIDLKRVGNTQWVVHDATMLGTSVREGLVSQLEEYIEEYGVAGAISEILSSRSDYAEE